MFKLATMVGVALLITLSGRPVSAAPDLSWVTSGYRNGDFKLVSGVSAADILIAPDDFKVVRIAADNLAMDTVNEERVIDEAPKLEYQLNLLQPGKVTITYYLVPTHPLTAAEGLRLAAGVDDRTPQLITIGKGLVVPSPTWFQNVLNATTTGASTHQVNTAGAHVLKIYMIDAGVVLDKIVVDTGGVRPSYLGPKETKVVTSAARR